MRKNWKVLIADDEPMIREGIRDIIDWQEMGMIVVAEAEDGEEAVELALQHVVEILLVDLNMPIMNGISVIEEVRKQIPDCKVVIITGHDEFHYAQQAVRLGVTDYILKPVDPVQLKEVLEKIRAELEAMVDKENYVKLAASQISKNLTLLRENFFRDLLSGNVPQEEGMQQLEFLELPGRVPEQVGVVHCPEYYANRPLMTEGEQQSFIDSLRRLMADIMGTNFLIMEHAGSFAVLAWGEMTEETLAEITQKAKDELKTAVQLCFERIQNGFGGISEAFQACKQAVEQDYSLSPIVRRARDYIQEHYSEQDISLEKVAEVIQVSPVYLSRVMKQELGTSFSSLITHLRIKKAIGLLNNTTLTILEIADQVGYDTQHYFSTAFKKVVGVSPNQYRKNPAEIGKHSLKEKITIKGTESASLKMRE